MPLGNNVQKNIKELMKDNKRSGKERGNNGKVRSKDQIIAIAYHAAHMDKVHKKQQGRQVGLRA